MQYVLVLLAFAYDFSQVTPRLLLLAFTFCLAAASTPASAPTGNVRSIRKRRVPGTGTASIVMVVAALEAFIFVISELIERDESLRMMGAVANDRASAVVVPASPLRR